MGQDPALKECVELVFDELGQARSCLELNLGKKGLEVFLDHLVQDGLLGAPALVERRDERMCRLDRGAGMVSVRSGAVWDQERFLE